MVTVRCGSEAIPLPCQTVNDTQAGRCWTWSQRNVVGSDQVCTGSLVSVADPHASMRPPLLLHPAFLLHGAYCRAPRLVTCEVLSALGHSLRACASYIPLTGIWDGPSTGWGCWTPRRSTWIIS